MGAVARRTQMNGVEENGEGHANGDDGRELDDLDAALLQAFIAKRVLHIDKAIDLLTTLADVTGRHPSEPIISRFRVRYSSRPRRVRRSSESSQCRNIGF
jgi:hypothetical protein